MPNISKQYPRSRDFVCELRHIRQSGICGWWGGGESKKTTKEKRIVAYIVRGLTHNGRTRNPFENKTRRKMRRFPAGNGTRPVSHITAACQRLVFIAADNDYHWSCHHNDIPNVRVHGGYIYWNKTCSWEYGKKNYRHGRLLTTPAP